MPSFPDAPADISETVNIVLPPHLRCAAHTLNLVAASDLANAHLPKECNQTLKSSLAKCTALCNKIQRST